MLFDAFRFRSGRSKVDGAVTRYLPARIPEKSIKKFLTLPLAMLGIPADGQLGFQEPATHIMEGIITLHHEMMFFLTFISIFVLYILIIISLRFNAAKHQEISQITHHTGIEVV